jgi:hypothetical protein
MKKSIVIVLASNAIIVVLFCLSSVEFLPWLRYRAITQWSSERNVYKPEIRVATDSTYRLIVSYSTYSQRVLIPWFGDSIDVMRIQDGFLKLDARKDVAGYDSNTVILTGNQIVPKKIGKTQFIIKLPNLVDTLSVEVEKIETMLAVH